MATMQKKTRFARPKCRDLKSPPPCQIPISVLDGTRIFFSVAFVITQSNHVTGGELGCKTAFIHTGYPSKGTTYLLNYLPPCSSRRRIYIPKVHPPFSDVQWASLDASWAAKSNIYHRRNRNGYIQSKQALKRSYSSLRMQQMKWTLDIKLSQDWSKQRISVASAIDHVVFRNNKIPGYK